MEYEDSYDAQIIMWKSLVRDAYLINDHYRAAYVATRKALDPEERNGNTDRQD